MHSELHDRLEYLVNYSSQLIFVSSDSVAQQQKTLEAFVFNQPDETDIAFITADQKMEIADYRCQLCRQLLGQTIGSYVRPLNELLASLNAHAGPILITITQAQHMPDQLLQELWDLVLQSRFAGNKQHLNVLVFGETRWAEKAKQWLPAKNTTTPLLISSQSVLPPPNELTVDKLIAQRRKDFEKHLAARYSSGLSTSSRKRPSIVFWTLIVIVFIASFGSLVGWLYGDKLDALFKPLESHQETEEVESVEVGTAFEELVASQSHISREPKTEESTVTSDDKNLQDPVEERNLSSELVTNWSDALEQTEKKKPKKPDTNNVDVLVSVQKNQEAAAKTQRDSESPNVSVQADNTPALTPQGSSIERLDNESIQASNYYIQLAGLKDDRLLNQFVNDHQLSSVVRMYKTERYGGDWFVLLFHQPFSTLDAARNALSNLPDYPSREKAFVKSGNQIKAELNQ